MCIQPVKVHGQKFEYIYIYILIYLREIIHRLEGSGVLCLFVFFLSSQNKMALFLSLVFLTRTKKNDLNSIYTKQNKTQ
jgi:hypothetical protein